LLTAIGATACGQTGAAPETPSQLLASGAKAFAALKTFHVSGGFIVSSTNDVFMTASVLQNGDATGALTIGFESANFVVANNTSYFDALPSFVTDGIADPSLAYLARLLRGQHWWQTSGSAAAAASFAMLKQATYSGRFFTGRTQLSESAVKDSRGRPALKLSDNSVSVFVAATAPHQVLEIRTAPHYLALDLSSVDLVFDRFDASARVSPPSAFVTSTADGMPAYFILQSLDFDGQCSPAGCPVKAVVLAETGSGSATVNFTVVDSAKRTLATCVGTVAVPAAGQTGTATCRAGGSAWTNFLYTGGMYSLGATVANPDYAS
jgi:hypothetical protein